MSETISITPFDKAPESNLGIEPQPGFASQPATEPTGVDSTGEAENGQAATSPAAATGEDVVVDLSAVADLPCEPIPPGAFPIQLTAKAVEMVQAALAETEGEDGDFLRVGVKGGGCAGFQYSLNFTDEVDDDDIATCVQGIKLVTDTFSASYLKGTDLDYVDSLQGAGFKFINPNAKRTCGCGSSFA